MSEKHSKIYTRRGDDGSTGLTAGNRVQKDSARMVAIGSVDELNCLIGVLAAMMVPQDLKMLLVRVQHDLFSIGAGLATPDSPMLGEDAVANLEREIDRMDAQLPPLRNFILPGGTLETASCHNARAVCRRAERRTLSMHRSDAGLSDPSILQYLNRLSDLLFVLARTLSHLEGGEEIFWNN